MIESEFLIKAIVSLLVTLIAILIAISIGSPTRQFVKDCERDNGVILLGYENYVCVKGSVVISELK